MALTAKQNKQMFFMICDVAISAGKDAAFTYYQQLQTSDTFALSEIANYKAQLITQLQNQLAPIQAQEAAINAQITVFS